MWRNREKARAGRTSTMGQSWLENPGVFCSSYTLGGTDTFGSVLRDDENDEEEAFTGDLNDLDMGDLSGEEYESTPSIVSLIDCACSDDLLHGPVQQLDLGSDSDQELGEPIVLGRSKRSKQAERPTKIVPTGSDLSSDDDEDADEDAADGRVTAKNMVARARALDARSARDAELDVAELQEAEAAGEADDDFADADMADLDEEDDGGATGGPFELPTTEEREEEQSRGGPDLQTLQRRMRACVRVLDNFARLGAGRSRSEYTTQLIADIAGYYGYNEFLAEKLLQLFPVGEVCMCA
jgi:ribosomal RNA methyltransferase Nop2